MLHSDGWWIETSWVAWKETVKLEAMSEAYFDLLAKHPRVAGILALGKRVVFGVGDVFYEVVPSAK